MKKVTLYTQGCRLNQAETASIEQQFTHKGYQHVPLSAQSELVVVNTCTVTENGDTDTKKLVRKIVKLNQKVDIALIGCQSQILKEALLELPNVKWVVGNNNKMNIANIIETPTKKPVLNVQKIERKPFTIPDSAIDIHHTRANIKIQDGCDFYCAFCVIPFARGPARSRVFEDIIRESIDLASAGHQEVVITGINVGTYEHNGKNLLDVIEAIEKIKGIERIRISSIEPTTIPKKLLKWMNEKEKLCNYLHIPIQSGSDTVLKGMNRKYSVKEFREFVELAYKTVPNICIGTDVIVGFPGETKACFDETVANLMTLPIHYFHVFSYSERKFARSKKFEQQISTEEIIKRSKILRRISQNKRKKYYENFINTTQPVLFEHQKHGYWSGLTEHYIRVKVASATSLKNKIINVTLTKIDKQAMLGELKI